MYYTGDLMRDFSKRITPSDSNDIKYYYCAEFYNYIHQHTEMRTPVRWSTLHLQQWQRFSVNQK